MTKFCALKIPNSTHKREYRSKTVQTGYLSKNGIDARGLLWLNNVKLRTSVNFPEFIDGCNGNVDQR